MRGETEMYTPPAPVTIVLEFLLGLWVDSLLKVIVHVHFLFSSRLTNFLLCNHFY